MSVEFVDPPPPATRGRKPGVLTPEILAAVKARPGQWARIYVAAPQKIQAAASTWCARHPEWEATARVVDPDLRRFDVYLRYVGDDA